MPGVQGGPGGGGTRRVDSEGDRRGRGCVARPVGLSVTLGGGSVERVHVEVCEIADPQGDEMAPGAEGGVGLDDDAGTADRDRDL